MRDQAGCALVRGEQQGATGLGVGHLLRVHWVGPGVTRDDDPPTCGAGGQEPADEVCAGQNAAGPVVEVEGERAVSSDRRMPEVGTDVLLDERGECRLGETAFAVDTDVNEKVELMRIDSRPPKAGLRCVVSEVACAVR